MNEVSIDMHKEVGNFAEDKDRAQQIRLNQIFPALNGGKTVILDFANVTSATQSFIHALISDIIRMEGIDILDRLLFKNCNEIIQGVIGIVVDYMQDPLGIDSQKQSAK